jgi:Lon protease-like protein
MTSRYSPEQLEEKIRGSYDVQELEDRELDAMLRQAARDARLRQQVEKLRDECRRDADTGVRWVADQLSALLAEPRETEEQATDGAT